MKKFGWIKRVMMAVAVPVMALSMTLAAPVNVSAEEEGAAGVAAVAEQMESAVLSGGSMAVDFGIPVTAPRFMAAAKVTSRNLPVVDGTASLSLDRDLNLTLNGTKKVKAFLVDLNGHKLTINGKGTIQASAGIGFAGNGSVVLDGGAKLIVNSKIANASSFICQGNLTVKKGTVKVTSNSSDADHIAAVVKKLTVNKGGTVNVTAKKGVAALGVNSSLIVKGGKVTANAKGTKSIGLLVIKKITMNKGQIVASGKIAAVCSTAKSSIKGAKITKPANATFYKQPYNGKNYYFIVSGNSIAKSVTIK